MAVRVYNTNEARNKWRELLETVRARQADVVIERYGERAAAVIPYEDFVALQDELEDLRLGRIAQAELDAYRRDPSTARPYEEIRRELIDEGLLDDE